MTQPDLLSRPDHDRFWCATPRKVGKRASQTAHKAAIKRASPELIQRATEAHAAIWNELTGYQSKKGKDKIEALKFCPHPATWLNGDRWEDEEIQEYLARPEEPEMIIVNRGDPGFAEWLNHKINTGGARSFWSKQDRIAVPTPFPPQTKGDE